METDIRNSIMSLNIVEKALKLQMNGHYRAGHLILSLFGIEIPKEVVVSEVGGAILYV